VAHSITVRTSVIPAPNPDIDRAVLRIETVRRIESRPRVQR